MYGISNSQQQGGGGGSAASYKAIRASLTYADWQEVAGATPYFVGDDATTWAKDSDTQQPMKISNSDLGIIAGQQYTITIEANGVEYSSTASADNNEGMLMIMFTFSETANAMVVLYDHFNWATKTVGDGSAMMVNTGQNTSLLITKFGGEGFGTSIQATISDSAIKVNSAVTMYTNTREKISVGTKTNGSVTLIAPSIPTSDLIPYSLEIVGTDTEGLFELINGYVPEISAAPQWHTIYEDTTGSGAVSVELSEPLQAGALYRITFGGSVYMFCSPNTGRESYVGSFTISAEVFQDATTMGHLTYNFTHRNTSLSLDYLAQYTITADGVSNISFANNSTIQALKITKVEVYR